MQINIKTEYNFFNSTIALKDIIKYAKAKQISTIGICDCATTFGFYKFYKACIDNNIKPLIGLELKNDDQEYLIYAKNAIGITRLNELNSDFLNEGTFNFLETEPNLILIIGKGIIPKQIIKEEHSEVLKNLKTIFNQDIYFGFFTHVNAKNNYLLTEKIQRSKLKSLVIDESRFIAAKDIEVFLTLKAIGDNKKINQMAQEKVKYQQMYLENNIEQTDCYEEFCEKINIKYPKQDYKPPSYPFLPNGINTNDYLYALAKKGLEKRKSTIEPKYQERLTFELDIIKKMGFSDYFLIVWEIIKFAKQEDIYVGPGRGSAAGSLVSYSLGITEIDPLKCNLLFERFLNPQRITMPDIDLDFEDERRNEVVDFIITRFGFQNVCKIGTISKFLAKSTFRDVAKAWNLDPGKIEFISKKLDSQLSFVQNIKANKGLRTTIIGNNELENITKVVEQIEGFPRQTSIHAAGIIIAEQRISNYCSVTKDNVSLAEASDLEAMGLLKIDILALSNLTFIHKIVDKINVLHHPFSLKDIGGNNQDVYELLSSAKTLGIFQMESPGMRETLKTVKPEKFSDIANVLALYRPGPKEFIGEYVKNRDTYKATNEIEAILKDTNGIIVFQEQIMLIATTMANYSLGEADILRRAISKKNQDALKEIEQNFIKSSIANGYDEEYAKRTYLLIAKFANYGFNKAHAYAYGMIVYQMAYLKVKYPEIFYSELFYYNFKSSKANEFLMELEKQDIKLLVPDILRSDLKVSIEKNQLRMGFLIIDGIGLELANSIISHRQYIKNIDSFEEMIFEVLLKVKISKNQINSLVDAGCFDRYGYNRKTLKHNLDAFLMTDAYALYQLGGEIEIEKIEDDDFLINSQLEKKAISTNIKYNIFTDILKEKEQQFGEKIFTIDEAFYHNNHADKQLSNVYNVLVKLDSIKEITTKKNDLMAFLSVTSKQVYDITVFSSEYSTYGKKINENINTFILCQIMIKGDRVILKKI